MKSRIKLSGATTLWMSGTPAGTLTLCTLVLLGSIEVVRAQDDSRSSITNGAQVATHPHVVKVVKPLANRATDLNQQTMSKDKRAEKAKHLAVTLSYDEKTQSVGAYDRPVIAEVEKHWRDLLTNIKQDSTGKVVLQFQLHRDGGVTELKLIGNTASDAIGAACRKAVLDSSPFPRWPKEMHKQVAADTRRLTLTFHYPPDEASREK